MVVLMFMVGFGLGFAALPVVNELFILNSVKGKKCCADKKDESVKVEILPDTKTQKRVKVGGVTYFKNKPKSKK